MRLSSTFGRLALAASVILTTSMGARAAETDEELREEALALNRITGTDAQTGKLRELIKDKDRAEKLLAVAAEMVKDEEGGGQPFRYNATLILAKVATFLEDVDTGKLFYEIGAKQAMDLRSPSKLIQIYDGMIDLYYAAGQYDEAARVCEEFLNSEGPADLNRGKLLVMERLIQVRAKQGQYDEALDMAERLVDATDAFKWYFLQTKGWVHREAGDHAEAARAYEDVLAELRTADLPKEEKDRETSNVRYILSGVYVDLKQIDKAAEQLQVLMRNDPDNPTYYNDLGYIWADAEMKLDESEKLIRKALELDEKQRKEMDLPEELDRPNAAYLDSLGWVLFRKGEFEKAKEYLEQAVKYEEGQHIEILDHLAETYVKLGDVDKAVELWKKSLTLDDVSPRDKDRRVRVKEKLDKYTQVD